jgi:serine protease Do
VMSLNAPSRWQRIWPVLAIAASVSLISVIGTLLYVSQNAKSKLVLVGRDIAQIRQSQQKMMNEIDATKKKINPFPGKYAGTGFLISPKGYLATSYHVVKEADSIHIENDRFGILKAIIVHSDPSNDISILKVEDVVLPSLPYTLVQSEAQIAEGVYTLGYPREDIVFGEGSISAITGYKQNQNAYQISVPVNPGNSGGPLLNNKGNVVGMISGVQTQVIGTSFAIKSSILLNVLSQPAIDSVQGVIPISKLNQMKNTSRVQQVKKWRDYVFMVRVYKN